jgi:hypothetical protein
MMQRYREKTKTIEAVQFDPNKYPWPKGVQSTLVSERYTIETPEGMAWLNPGDWIVKGSVGAIRVCVNQIFRELYEPVDEIEAPAYETVYNKVMARINEDIRRSGGTS